MVFKRHFNILMAASLLFCLQTVFGQERWQDARLFKSDSTDLRVQVDLIQLENDPGILNYREPGAEEQTIRASHVKEIRLDMGRRFVTKHIMMDDRYQYVIAEYLVDGVLDIYVLNYPLNEVYLLETPGKEIEIAQFGTRKAVSPDPTAKDVEVRSYRHIGLLIAFMADAPELHDDIQTMHMDQKNLIKITQRYHEMKCAPGEACIVYKKEGIYSMSTIGLTAGVVYRKIKMRQKGTDNILKFNGSMGYTAGGVFQLPLPSRKVRYHFETALLISASRDQSTFTHSDKYYDYVQSLSYNYSSIKFQPGIRASVYSERMIWTLSAGPVFNMTLNQYMTNERDFYLDGEFYRTYTFEDAVYAPIAGGVNFNAGIILPVFQEKKVHLQVGYEYLHTSFDIPKLYTLSSKSYLITEQTFSARTTFFF